MTWSISCHLLRYRHPPRLVSSLVAAGRAHHLWIADLCARRSRYLVRQILSSGSPQGLWWDFRFYSRVSQCASADESEPIRLDDSLALRGDIKQDWDARTAIIFVGPLERQFCLLPPWLARHGDSRRFASWSDLRDRVRIAPRRVPTDLSIAT